MTQKYIFFDIDGTLVSHVGTSHIPEETRLALTRLKEKGHVTALATARAAFLTRPLAAEFGIDLTVCCNGAHILSGDESLETTWLSERTMSLFRQSAENFPEETAALDDRWVYSDGASEEATLYLASQAGYDCVRPISELDRAFLLYLFAPQIPKKCALFTAPPPDSALDPSPHFTEIRPAGVTKWGGILKLSQLFGFGREDVVTFGDNRNDVEMLREASIGVAVGAAKEAVKAAADLVTDDIDAGGILNACCALGLI